MGVVEVTLNVPEVSVSEPAMPRTEPVPSCREVPFNVALNRFAVPSSVDVPVNVTVPAEAVSEPVTVTFDAMEKLRAVVIVPVTFSAEKVREPAPEIDLDVPESVIVPLEAVREPEAFRSPAMSNVEVLDIAPPEPMARLLKLLPVPLMLPVAELIVTVPLPPDVWVNVPEPLVEKFPPTAMLEDASAVIPAPVITR